MPSFALSRRQHGFESRWGHKITSTLTRPDGRWQARYPLLYRQGPAMVADAVNWKPHDRRQPFPVGAILDGLDESERLLQVGTLAIPRRPGRASGGRGPTAA
jgi:hypothetical protein